MKSVYRGLAQSSAALAVLSLAAGSIGAQTAQTPPAKSSGGETKDVSAAPSDKATSSSAKASATAGKVSGKEMRYDSKMEKRADQRLQFNKSPHAGTVNPGSSGIDRSRMVDFMNIQGKRSDLRMRVAKVGFEQAYAEWSGQKVAR